MAEGDDLCATFANLVLCAVASNGIGRFHGRNYTHPGMHINYFVHGVLGFLQDQGKHFNIDTKAAYEISTHASRYLPLPCLMADLYSSDNILSPLYLLSGLIPFGMALSGKNNPQMGNLMVAGNIVSLFLYAMGHNRDWAYYTAGGAVMAYFVSPQVNKKVSYPLFLALVDYCAYRVSHLNFTSL